KYTLDVNISGGDARSVPTFKWCISQGRITKGKGTSSIEIDAAGVKDEVITVTVIVGGFPAPCDNVAVYKIALTEDSNPDAAPPDIGRRRTRKSNSRKMNFGHAADAGR
ncbi:MAG: hypothetical protein QOJ76_3054, partial [Acidobacteriota bacterium]|nr:hypothetical protein [Acidobacteriota bacterium]